MTHHQTVAHRPDASAGEAAELRDATSVILVRDGDSGLQTWVIERVTKMAFAAGMTVFPGGKAESADASLPWASAGPERLVAQLGGDETLIRALIGAGIRETFEETGVLLTVPPVTGDLRERRTELERTGVGFGDFLAAHAALLDAQRLIPWARWITPAGAPRRFDTWFFVVGLPDDEEPFDVSSESAHAYWASVETLLEEHRAGRRPMLPPTIAHLSDLAQLGTVDAVLASGPTRSMAPVQPLVVTLADGSQQLQLPDGTTLLTISGGTPA
jgi:8-oxo-dGTP pyrophosphatase MutT (NUDIX family)